MSYLNAQPGAMHWWQGESGAWYIHSVYKIGAVPDFTSANYIYVRRELNGSCSPIYIGQTRDADDRLSSHEKATSATLLGANEVHIHLLAETRAERFRVESDIRRGHWTPLNRQPTPARPATGLFGGFG